MKLKNLTIRLSEDDLENIALLKAHYHINTISGIIKHALLIATKFIQIKEIIRKAIKVEYKIDKESIESLNHFYEYHEMIHIDNK